MQNTVLPVACSIISSGFRHCSLPLPQYWPPAPLLRPGKVSPPHFPVFLFMVPTTHTATIVPYNFLVSEVPALISKDVVLGRCTDDMPCSSSGSRLPDLACFLVPSINLIIL